MIAHLSSEQVSEYIAGQPSADIARHVEGCPACRAELANFREALGEFGGIVRAWSEDQAGRYQANAALAPAGAEQDSWRASRQLGWALAVAVVCILASFVFPKRNVDGAAAFAASDAALLNQVDAQVSRTVPSSMEPLMELVVQTNAGTGEAEITASRNKDKQE